MPSLLPALFILFLVQTPLEPLREEEDKAVVAAEEPRAVAPGEEGATSLYPSKSVRSSLLIVASFVCVPMFRVSKTISSSLRPEQVRRGGGRGGRRR